MNKKNITHNSHNITYSDAVKIIENNISNHPSSLFYKQYTKNDAQKILKELESFPLGKFLIEHKGVSGSWTDYILNYPNDIPKKNLSKTEAFILQKAPLTLSHRERFHFFQSEVTKLLKNNIEILSLPCGCMRDLLEIDYSKLDTYTLTGIDIDSESLEAAKQLAKEKNISSHCQFIQKDAWALKVTNKFDVITSNGLNVYESDEQKRNGLYKILYNALKPNGHLIMGFLTPPPIFENCEWNMNEINNEDLDFEILLFAKILQTHWLNYSTSGDMLRILQKIGFKKVRFQYDKAKLFPVVIATK